MGLYGKTVPKTAEVRTPIANTCKVSLYLRISTIIGLEGHNYVWDGRDV
jgi:hypothetical protein